MHPLFTQVRGRGILRTSPMLHSTKFGLAGFSDVGGLGGASVLLLVRHGVGAETGAEWEEYVLYLCRKCAERS